MHVFLVCFYAIQTIDCNEILTEKQEKFKEQECEHFPASLTFKLLKIIRFTMVK